MISLNTQPAEKPDIRDDGSLDIVSVFQTIQGEGPLSGTPAVFTRLAGCNLQCPACDTSYTEGRKLYTPEEILFRIQSVRSKETNLIVITGGEPFRQNLYDFIHLCLDEHFDVQIETNGTLPPRRWNHRDFRDNVSIVCSPKTGKVHLGLQPDISALKYVIESGCVDPDDGLPTSVLGLHCKVARPWAFYYGPIFVQPQDDQDKEKNKANIKAAVDSCLKFGYRLSFQTHKYIGLE